MRTHAEPTFAPGWRSQGWIHQWDPDDDTFWAGPGRRIARKNLALSMFTDHIGFCIWVV